MSAAATTPDATHLPPPALSSRKRVRRLRTWWCSTWCCGATWRMCGRGGAWWRRGAMPPWPPSRGTATTRTPPPTARPATSTACTSREDDLRASPVRTPRLPSPRTTSMTMRRRTRPRPACRTRCGNLG